MNNGETNQQDSLRHLFANGSDAARDETTHSEKILLSSAARGNRKLKESEGTKMQGKQ